MIQDIAPHTYHNEYKPSAPDKNSFILAYEKGSILLPHQEREADIYFPRFQDLEEKVSDLYSKYIYLFSIDDQRFYLIPELPRFIAFTGISTVSIVYKTDGISEASSLTRTGWMI